MTLISGYDGYEEGYGGEPSSSLDLPLNDDGPEEPTDVGRDTITGLNVGTQLPVEPDPPPRTAPITPFMDDEHSQGVYKPPVTPNQSYPTRDVRPA